MGALEARQVIAAEFYMLGGWGGGLMELWFLLLPFVLIGAGINWLYRKATGK